MAYYNVRRGNLNNNVNSDYFITTLSRNLNKKGWHYVEDLYNNDEHVFQKTNGEKTYEIYIKKNHGLIDVSVPLFSLDYNYKTQFNLSYRAYEYIINHVNKEQ